MKDSNVEALIASGLAAHESGRLQEALGRYREALKLNPDDAETLSLFGLALLQSGDSAAADAPLHRAVELEPEQTGLRMNLVELLVRRKQFTEALSHLDAICIAHPGAARAWERRGDIHVDLNELDQAAEAYWQVLQLEPQNHVVARRMIRVLINLSRMNDALQLLIVTSKLVPLDEDLFDLYVATLSGIRDWPALESLSRTYAEHRPGSPAAWRALGRAHYEQSRYGLAAEACRKILDLGSAAAADLTLYGRICIQAQHYAEAARVLDQAEPLAPDDVDMLAAKGLLLLIAGRFDEAARYNQRAIALNPAYAPAYTQLSRLRSGQLSQGELHNVGLIAANPELVIEWRISAAFALADALDAAGQTDEAFDAYGKANALCHARSIAENIAYQRDRSAARTDRIISLSRQTEATPETRYEGPQPIFIVGMPRSGTTLVEALLAAHSRVRACGERPHMQQILDLYLAITDPALITPKHLQNWTDAYVRELSPLSAADRFTDKQPLNIEAVGLIARLFPQASILHIRRDPLETCLSVFRHEFDKYWNFAHSLDDAAHYYLQYARLVAHWEKALGPRFHTVQYESLAGDFASEAPKLLQACGLEWEEGCAQFQKQAGTVATLSAVQVREPVRLRNDRGERYAAHLGALRESLTQAGVDLRTGALLHTQ